MSAASGGGPKPGELFEDVDEGLLRAADAGPGVRVDVREGEVVYRYPDGRIVRHQLERTG